MFTQELKKAMETGALLEVYTNERDTSKYDVGTVAACDEDVFVLRTVTKYGKLDGLVLQEVGSVVRVSEDTVYLRRIATLMRYHNEKPPKIALGENPIFDLLEYCRRNNRIASIDILGSGLCDARGYVEELDEEKCVIKQISEDGKNDGTTVVLLNDISYISCCSGDEVALEILNSELFDEMHSN